MSDIVQRGDPIGGMWNYNANQEWVVYTDASKHALGVALTIGGVYVEDSTRLRSVRDCRHINLAELEAAILGLQLIGKYITVLNCEAGKKEQANEVVLCRISGHTLIIEDVPERFQNLAAPWCASRIAFYLSLTGRITSSQSGKPQGCRTINAFPTNILGELSPPVD
ncbi:hypothetical protein Pmar_PMAR020958 [Perkinsus marinus ATCC 50983]|uniref:RNase H type-1 domain-containing protein n=1 Tax=Perkinsus marinus (strain ATCC 50983 / TXsc) TaxID=423536 RepID=C5KKY0_PERM5|nr:hypothetical protein Pmar_PMAR020958 [Perkinsus marinus ATCC 50983]EER14863.1 hypothetical protein Pmar_PMAR020958 [Perkinsus marinus ATCC 50983]|eukprot:XP_002783067.1 hypothetical protein Pmar_PMAR020958 [Perkinsus marinus ATCC 50983]